jgi:hypothetical protein
MLSNSYAIYPGGLAICPGKNMDGASAAETRFATQLFFQEYVMDRRIGFKKRDQEADFTMRST